MQLLTTCQLIPSLFLARDPENQDPETAKSEAREHPPSWPPLLYILSMMLHDMEYFIGQFGCGVLCVLSLSFLYTCAQVGHGELKSP